MGVRSLLWLKSILTQREEHLTRNLQSFSRNMAQSSFKKSSQSFVRQEERPGWELAGYQREPTGAMICRLLDVAPTTKPDRKEARDHDSKAVVDCRHGETTHGGNRHAYWVQCCSCRQSVEYYSIKRIEVMEARELQQALKVKVKPPLYSADMPPCVQRMWTLFEVHPEMRPAMKVTPSPTQAPTQKPRPKATTSQSVSAPTSPRIEVPGAKPKARTRSESASSSKGKKNPVQMRIADSTDSERSQESENEHVSDDNWEMAGGANKTKSNMIKAPNAMISEQNVDPATVAVCDEIASRIGLGPRA